MGGRPGAARDRKCTTAETSHALTSRATTNVLVVELEREGLLLGRAGATTTTGAERPFTPFSLEQPGQVVISWSRRLPGQLAGWAGSGWLMITFCFCFCFCFRLSDSARRLSG